MKNSSLELVTQAPSAIAANSVSSLPQQRLDPSCGGQMIAPILSRKGTSKSGAFPKEKAHNERAPFPREQSARALRAMQAPSAIAANSVSSLPEQRLDPSRGGQMIAPILSRKGMSKSGAFSICDRRELSLFTASAAAGPEPWGADDRPNSLKKRDEQERSFSQRKGSQ